MYINTDQHIEKAMNKRKKLNSILTSRAKKANLKANPKHKTPYVSKAERERLAAAATSESVE